MERVLNGTKRFPGSETMLHWAMAIHNQSPDRLDMVRTLLRAGADCNVKLLVHSRCFIRHIIELAVEGHTDFSYLKLLFQENNPSLDRMGYSWFNLTNQDYLPRRECMEMMVEMGYNVENEIGIEQEIIDSFRERIHTNRPENSPWVDGKFSTHLGTPVVESDSPVDEDWSEEEEEDISRCSECTEEAVDAFLARIPCEMDEEALNCFGLCWLRHFMLQPYTPRRLKSICRQKIRKSLNGVKMREKAYQLGLPDMLVNYVLFQAMD